MQPTVLTVLLRASAMRLYFVTASRGRHVRLKSARSTAQADVQRMACKNRRRNSTCKCSVGTGAVSSAAGRPAPACARALCSLHVLSLSEPDRPQPASRSPVHLSSTAERLRMRRSEPGRRRWARPVASAFSMSAPDQAAVPEQAAGRPAPGCPAGPSSQSGLVSSPCPMRYSTHLSSS